MGSKFTSTTVSGFNASPPSDDGSTASTNKVFWSTIKTKLADPLNTFAAAINSALLTAFDYSARSVTSADSTVAGDHMRTLAVPSTVTTTFTISLADAATMANGYIVRVRNSSQVGITIGRATVGDTLDGAASNKLLPPGATGVYAVNASANGYITQAYAGPVQDADAIVAGGTDGTKKVRLEVDGLTTGTTRVLTVPDANIVIAGSSSALSINRLPKAGASGILTDTSITVDSSNQVTNSSQPSFLAYLSSSSNNQTGDGTVYTVICDAEVFDQNADYDNTTGTFTAPVTGKYDLKVVALLDGLLGAHTDIRIRIVTSNRTYSTDDAFGTNPFTSKTMLLHALADMDAADTATMAVSASNGTKVVDIIGGTTLFTYFSGFCAH